MISLHLAVVYFSFLDILPNKPIATMAGRKKTCTTEEVLAILAEDSGAAILPVDSESDDEDLLQPELHPDSSDSDYVLPPSERYVISLFDRLLGVRLFIYPPYYPAMNLVKSHTQAGWWLPQHRAYFPQHPYRVTFLFGVILSNV